MSNTIRMIKPQDIPALKAVLNSIDLFPAEMLDDMMADYLNNPQSADIWLTSVLNELPIAIAYCAPEQMTEGTYNLYAIGVQQELQGKGIGSKIMHQLETLLKEKGARILIVDTSGLPSFEQTRAFYTQLNYTQEAIIRDFWSEGDDKVTFWKKL